MHLHRIQNPNTIKRYYTSFTSVQTHNRTWRKSMASSNLPIIDLECLFHQKDLSNISNDLHADEKKSEDTSTSTITTTTTASVAEAGVPQQVQQVANEIHNACKTHGFFYVKNHGIDPNLIHKMMQQTKDLFNLSLTKKYELSSKNNKLFRGYISTSDGLHTCNSKKKMEVGLDQKESFTLGAEHPCMTSSTTNVMPSSSSTTTTTTSPSPMHGPNQWPEEDDLPDFKSTMEEYWNAQLTLCRIIAKGLALSLKLPPTFFDPHLTNPVAQMVLLKYPPPPESMDMASCQLKHPGCGEHTDCGFLTILTQDLPGLEVQDPISNEWKSVEPIKDTFVVNLGDMAARWTNDTYKSTKHRVYNNTKYTRYSVPFFCNCNFDAPIECIMDSSISSSNATSIEGEEECNASSTKEEAKYEPTTAGAYILKRLGLMRLVN